MTQDETRAVLTLALLAAFADGEKHARERDEIKRIAEGFAAPEALNVPTLYRDVLMKRVDIASVAAALSSREAKQLAYEMAVCVCDADGAQSEAERRFLEEARVALGLAAPAAAEISRQAESIAAAPVAEPSTAAVNEEEIDRMILEAAITNGALELLPETISTLAIIPLQMRLVFNIGKAHGYDLDTGHIKDFLATAGAGLTSQYLEQAGRKLLGGLLGRIGGGLVRGLGNQAISSGMSFASTYAIGQVARRYYAGEREFSAQMLKDTYAAILREGQALQGEYLPAMKEKARSLDVAKLLAGARLGS